MIDYSESKIIECAGDEYEIGRVSKREFALMRCEVETLPPSEDAEYTVQLTKIFYKYFGYFLIGGTVGGELIPAPTSERVDGRFVRCVPASWVADNIDGIVAFELLSACIEFNIPAPDVKKN